MKNKAYPLYHTAPVIHDLQEMIQIKVNSKPDEIAFRFPVNRKEYGDKTYKEFSNDITAIQVMLRNTDVSDEHIAIIGENSYEWIVSFLAITNCGKVAVPIDKNLDKNLVKQLLDIAECSRVIASPDYIDLVQDIGITVISFDEIKEWITNNNDGKSQEIYVIDREKCAAIFFTSGTTGIPKGVMLSHQNIASDINLASELFELKGNTVAVLPFHHTFGFITAILKPFNYGYTTFINKSLKNAARDIKANRPEMVFLVPAFVEAFYKSIHKGITDKGLSDKVEQGEKVSKLLLKFGIDQRRKIFKTIISEFGGNLKYIICGGAPLDQKYIDAFQNWGIQILNGYGITECSPVLAVNRNFQVKDGSAGHLLPDIEAKISDKGEILVKGPNVMLGYYKNQEETDKVLENGWFHTGDIGSIDDDHFLFITGRIKNLIILSNGENISPEELEMKISADDNVKEVVVYAENDSIIAEIYPENEYLDNQEYFEKLIERINDNQPIYKQIHKVVLRDEEFEKNSSTKILRQKVGK